MTTLLDCLVSYFSFDTDEEGRPSRYFCYHVIGGAGATRQGGVACVSTLAVHDENERCAFCPNFHTVKTGGPVAALAKAIHYLDAYHEEDHLRKVQSAVRWLDGEHVLASHLAGTEADNE